jgi:hypothetical protein
MKVGTEENTTGLDTSLAYTATGYRGVAIRLIGWAQESAAIYELVCEDEECDHQLSEMCWGNEGAEITWSDTMVRAYMVGDDRVLLIDRDDLTPIDELDYCAGCGQIGCGHDGRERNE